MSIKRILSEEHKFKIGLANKGNKRPDLSEYNRKYKPLYIGSQNPYFGKKHSSETKALISSHHANFKMENHPQWLGGISFESYGVEFTEKLKEKIRDRDKHRCMECGYLENILDRKLSIHHIDYDKKNNSSENLISLCQPCHLQTNWGRNDWTQYFKDKVSE